MQAIRNSLRSHSDPEGFPVPGDPSREIGQLPTSS